MAKEPLSIRQTFILECVINQYIHLKEIFSNFPTNTRNKSINLPINDLEVGRKNFRFIACKTFNKLPKNLKNLNCEEKIIKYHLKNCIKDNLNTKEKIDSILKPLGTYFRINY